jgi:type 1 fimbria pilin
VRRPSRAPGGFLVALLVAVVLASSPAAYAQSGGNATLRGTVVDQTGGVLPGATVTLTNCATRAIQTSDTDARGAYLFTGVFPGTYDLRVQLDGFKTFDQIGLVISTQDTRGLDITLLLGERSERVTVKADNDAIQTQTGAREGVLTAPQIDNLSVISRSALELLRILPGVVAPYPSELESVSFDGGANRTSGYTVNGVRGTNNAVQLDGSSLTEIGSKNGSIVTLNNDMVQEVKVQSSNYAAEHGSAAVAISAVTKSGSSVVHGVLYAYNRNYHFAANDRSNNIFGIEKPKSAFNYPGGNIGGPLVVPRWTYTNQRDKLFFFVGLEVQRQKIDMGARRAVVPTLLQRQGLFTESLVSDGLNLGQSVGPVLIPTGFPGAGTPAPGADLGPYMHPLGRLLANLYPLPTGRYDDNSFNYATAALEPVNRLDFKTRVDWNPSASTRAYLRIAREDERVTDAFGQWGPSSEVPLPSAAIETNRGRSYAANVVTVLSPSMTNEALVSWSRLRLDGTYQDPAKMRLDALGASWTGTFPGQSPYVPGVVGNWGVGVANLWSPNMDLYAHNDALQFSDKLTRVAGAHALKFGASIERLQKQVIFPNQAEGLFSFDSSFTPGTTGNTVGDILTGRVSTYVQGTRYPDGRFRMWNVDAFAQDSWKLRPNLTLEYGVRGGYWTNNAELNGLGGWFDPGRYDPTRPAWLDEPTFQQLNGVCYVSTGCAGPGIFANRRPFAMPRVNVAWDIAGNGTHVLRGGYGVFFNRPPGNSAEYTAMGMPPAIRTVGQDAYGGFGYGGGVGLTYDSAKETTLASQQGGSTYWVTFTPRSFAFPKIESFSITYARRLLFGQVIEAAYVGTRGRRLVSAIDANPVPEGALLQGVVGNADLSVPVNRVALDAVAVNQFRPYQAYGLIQFLEFAGVSDYNSLQVTLSRQSGRRVQYFAAYTLARSRGTFGDDSYSLRDPFDPKRTYGILNTDRTHTLTVSWNAMLPDGARGVLQHAVLRGLLNGWQLSGISTVVSGEPIWLGLSGQAQTYGIYQAHYGTPDIMGPLGGILSPVYTCDPRLGGTKVGEKVLDLSCIQVPALGQEGEPLPPYNIRRPHRQDHDLTVFKNFALRGSQKLQLRFGFFNIFNTAYANDIDTRLDTDCNQYVDHVPNGVGGYVDHVCDPSAGMFYTGLTKANFGTIISKTGHRVIELALKYYF